MTSSNRVAVITGGANGIGLATAHELAQRGLAVVIADIDAYAAEAAADDVAASGVDTLAVACDVSSDDEVGALRDAALARFDRVDVVMANAGVNGVPDDTIEGWKWLVDINLFGVIRTVDAFLPHLLDRGTGHLIATSSGYGVMGQRSAYAAAKWGVIGFCEGVAFETRKRGVGVSVLIPGLVRTALTATTAKVLGRPEPASGGAGALGDLPGVLSASECASQLLAGLDAGRFLIASTFPDRVVGEVQARVDAIEESHWRLPPFFKDDRSKLWLTAIGQDRD